MKKKFGIIGNPIKHSLSPVLHKYWFNKYNIDADYTIIEANDKELPEIIKKVTLIPDTNIKTDQLKKTSKVCPISG